MLLIHYASGTKCLPCAGGYGQFSLFSTGRRDERTQQGHFLALGFQFLAQGEHLVTQGGEDADKVGGTPPPLRG